MNSDFIRENKILHGLDTFLKRTGLDGVISKVVEEIGLPRLITAAVVIGAAIAITGGAALPAIVMGAVAGAGFSYGAQVWQNYNEGLTGADAWTNVNGWDIARGATDEAITTPVFGLAGLFLAPVGLAAKGIIRRVGGWLGGKAANALGRLGLKSGLSALRGTLGAKALQNGLKRRLNHIFPPGGPEWLQRGATNAAKWLGRHVDDFNTGLNKQLRQQFSV